MPSEQLLQNLNNLQSTLHFSLSAGDVHSLIQSLLLLVVLYILHQILQALSKTNALVQKAFEKSSILRDD